MSAKLHEDGGGFERNVHRKDKTACSREIRFSCRLQEKSLDA